MTVDQLDALDWKTFTSIRDFLKNFYNATKTTEGRNGTIDSVLPAMDFLFEMFEQGAEEFRHDTYGSLCIDAGWKKLVQYYKKADCASSYLFFSSCFTSIHNPLGYDRHLASLAYMVSPSYIAAKSHKEVILFQGLGAGVEV